MHPDVAAIRRAGAWKRIDAAMEVMAADIYPDSLNRFRNPPVPAYEHEARELYRIEAIADLMTALSDQTNPLATLPVDDDVRSALLDEGYESLVDITQADDNELLAIEGIGQKTLDAIRSVAPHDTSIEQAGARRPVAAGLPVPAAPQTEAVDGTDSPESAAPADESPQNATSVADSSAASPLPDASAATEPGSGGGGNASAMPDASDGGSSGGPTPNASEATNIRKPRSR